MSKGTTVYLTRHGETEWNLEHRMQGHRDSALTPLGISQAEWLAKGLSGVDIDAVYSSPSSRAMRTAEIICGGRPLPVNAAPEFMEMGLGCWEGRISLELEREYPEQYQAFWNNPAAFGVEGSETFADVLGRSLSKLEAIVAAHPGQTVLVVTHTVVIKCLMTHFEDRPLERLWDLPYIYPTCLSRVDFGGEKPFIGLHADTSHYPADMTEKEG